MTSVETSATFVLYPFVHDVPLQSSSKRTAQIQNLALRWRPWWDRMEDADAQRAIDDSFYFLPYIRDVMFAEAALLVDPSSGTTREKWLASIQSKVKEGLVPWIDSVCGAARKRGIHPMLRLTLQAKTIAPLHFLSILLRPDGGDTLQVKIHWVDAVLFPDGVGFLVLKIGLAKDETSTLECLHTLNTAFRNVHPRFYSEALPRFRLGEDINAPVLTLRDLMNYLTEGFTGGSLSPDLPIFLASSASALHPRYSGQPGSVIYGQKCQLLTAAHIVSSDDAPAGHFADATERILYEITTGTSPEASVSVPIWIPARQEIERQRVENRITAWDCWSGLALKDGMGFVTRESVGFLWSNMEYDYLPLYLLALYQKLQLLRFADAIMRANALPRAALGNLRRVKNDFFQFRNRYWFNEVAQGSLGGLMYRRIHAGLETIPLYDLVCTEISDQKAHQEEINSSRTEALINALTFIFVPLGAVIGIFGMNFVLNVGWREFGLACLTVGIISAILWAVLHVWRPRS